MDNLSQEMIKSAINVFEKNEQKEALWWKAHPEVTKEFIDNPSFREYLKEMDIEFTINNKQ